MLLQGGSLLERGRGGGRCLWQKFSLGKQAGADPMLLFGGPSACKERQPVVWGPSRAFLVASANGEPGFLSRRAPLFLWLVPQLATLFAAAQARS